MVDKISDTGIAEKTRQEIVEGLNVLVSDTFALYLKTHYYHWNVTGPMFGSLHTLFEDMYNEIWLAVDLIAERIRALGERAPGTFDVYSKLTSLKDLEQAPNAKQMIQDLMQDNLTLSLSAHKVFPLADDANDQATADMVTARMQEHEKNAWMLRSFLEE